MIRKLRWQFIGGAVGAISIVLIILVLGINITQRLSTRSGQDRLLDFIAENGGELRRPGIRRRPPETFSFRITDETPFETRYFVIRTDSEGNIRETNLENIAAITGNDSQYYIDKAESAGTVRGTIDRYRFCKAVDADETLYIFLDIGRQQFSARNLLVISLILTAAAIAAAFVIAYFYSNRVIARTVRGIESQKRFITDASHEMKTPITAISAYANVLGLENAENEWIQGIHRETKRLSGLVNNLVELSRWDENEELVRNEAFSLTDSLWDTVTPYQNMAAGAGLRLEVDIEDGLEAYGDEASFQKAISAILDNALKYSLPESIVSVRAYRKKRSICIDAENACSLDSETELNKLFERFYRADPSRSRESGGNGVGLSIARAIIEAHGGTVSAFFSSPGIICFRILLPG